MYRILPALFLFALFAVAPVAEACSPAPSWPPSFADNFAQKEIAFVGTVASVMQDKSVNADYRITFEVDAAYKGDLDERVTVLARSSSAACGYDDGYDMFEEGSVWTIFGTGTAIEGYRTDSLSLNVQFDSVAEAKEAFEDEGIREIGDSTPIACTMQYAPVCGRDASGTERTYGNACMLNADKAVKLYDGECRTDDTIPAGNLSIGSRGIEVTWLQNFLIDALAGAAAEALKAVGATGYFGSMTRAALAEYQGAHGISPAAGFFGPITRAHILSAVSPAPAPAATAVFKGEITEIDTGCFADGICSVTIDGKEVILLAGFRMDAPPIGTLYGADSIGALESEIGSTAEVYAAETAEGDADYTLYGSADFYVKLIED